MRSLRAAWRLLRMLLHLLHGMAVMAWRFPSLDTAGRQRRIQWWSAGLLRVAGLQLQVSGTPRSGATLLVANHVSWLDIAAIHAVAPQARFVSTVYHGLPRDLYTLQPQPGEYFAFLGRISAEKRVDLAIEIAQRLQIPLKIAAKIDRADQAYWDEMIAPLVRANPNVEYVGEINERQKEAFLGNAAALLFPIDWEEPFGLVMIEAMACGTPVIAFRAGSVPEVIDHGQSGFIVSNIDEAVAAVERALELPRAGVRAVFDKRFTARRMASDYVDIYRASAARRRIAASDVQAIAV